MFYLPTMDEEAHEYATDALESFGMSAVDAYCRYLCRDADTYETTGPETSEGYARITLTDSDRVALVILNAADRAGRNIRGEAFSATIDETDTRDNWSRFVSAVIFWDDRGFYYPDFLATEEETETAWLAALEHCAQGWSDEDEEEN